MSEVVNGAPGYLLGHRKPETDRQCGNMAVSGGGVRRRWFPRRSIDYLARIKP